MNTSEFFERIRNHPGVTVRTHQSPEAHTDRRHSVSSRRLYAKPTPELLRQVKKLEAGGMGRKDACARLNLCASTVFNYIGPKGFKGKWKRVR